MPNQLYSNAQTRSFLSRFKDKSRSSMERQMNAVDDAIREIALHHGTKHISLDYDISKAIEHLHNLNFSKVEKYLDSFNNALVEIVKTINQMAPEMVAMADKLASQNYNFTKQAGWRDFFSKKEDPELSFEQQNEQLISTFKYEVKDLVNQARSTNQVIKRIFKQLEEHRAEGEVPQYIKSLMALAYQQKLFTQALNDAKIKTFRPLDDIKATHQQIKSEDQPKSIKTHLREMSEDLYQPKTLERAKLLDPIGIGGGISSPTLVPSTFRSRPRITPPPGPEIDPESPSFEFEIGERCPCDSGLAWAGCHGQDRSKIWEIMVRKNNKKPEDEKLSPEDLKKDFDTNGKQFGYAERQYYFQVNAQNTKETREYAEQQARLEAEREQYRQGLEELNLRSSMLSTASKQQKIKSRKYLLSYLLET